MGILPTFPFCFFRCLLALASADLLSVGAAPRRLSLPLRCPVIIDVFVVCFPPPRLSFDTSVFLSSPYLGFFKG